MLLQMFSSFSIAHCKSNIVSLRSGNKKPSVKPKAFLFGPLKACLQKRTNEKALAAILIKRIRFVNFDKRRSRVESVPAKRYKKY